MFGMNEHVTELLINIHGRTIVHCSKIVEAQIDSPVTEGNFKLHSYKRYYIE